jgi:hypothetical protein
VIKNDLTFDKLLFAFDKVIKTKHYSQSVIKMLESQEHNIEIALFEKQILFHLSKRTDVKDMPQYIPISLNAIEVRKLNLKELLKVRTETIAIWFGKPELSGYYFKGLMRIKKGQLSN